MPLHPKLPPNIFRGIPLYSGLSSFLPILTYNKIAFIRNIYLNRNDPYAIGIQLLTELISDSEYVSIPFYRNKSKDEISKNMPKFIPATTTSPIVPDMIVLDLKAKNQISMLYNPIYNLPNAYDITLLTILMKSQYFNMVLVGDISIEDNDADSWQFAFNLVANEAIETRTKKGRVMCFTPFAKRIFIFTKGFLIEWELRNLKTNQSMPITPKWMEIIREEFNKYDGWNTGDTPLLALKPLMNG